MTLQKYFSLLSLHRLQLHTFISLLCFLATHLSSSSGLSHMGPAATYNGHLSPLLSSPLLSPLPSSSPLPPPIPIFVPTDEALKELCEICSNVALTASPCVCVKASSSFYCALCSPPPPSHQLSGSSVCNIKNTNCFKRFTKLSQMSVNHGL